MVDRVSPNCIPVKYNTGRYPYLPEAIFLCRSNDILYL